MYKYPSTVKALGCEGNSENHAKDITHLCENSLVLTSFVASDFDFCIVALMSLTHFMVRISNFSLSSSSWSQKTTYNQL